MISLACPRCGDIVARLTRALELWHDGDSIAAVQVIEDVRRELQQPPVRRPYQCECGERFAWPGQLDDHRRLTCRRLRLRSRRVA